MRADIREEARSVWRRELAVAELWRLLGFTSLVMHAPAGDEKQLMLGALRSMFAEGHADVDALLEEAEGYLAFVDVPKSDEIARKLERQLRALSDGEAPPGYVQEDLSELSKANHNRLEALEPGREKAKGYLLATVDLARAGADAGSCEAMCFFREEVPEDLIGEVVKGWKQAIRTQEERRGYMAEMAPDLAALQRLPQPLVRGVLGLRGVRVIPTVSWSDESSYPFCFMGVGRGSPVAVSTVGVGLSDPEERRLFEEGFREMLSRIEPRAVLVQAESLPQGLLEDGGLGGAEVRLYPPRWKSIREARKLAAGGRA